MIFIAFFCFYSLIYLVHYPPAFNPFLHIHDMNILLLGCLLHHFLQVICGIPAPVEDSYSFITFFF